MNRYFRAVALAAALVFVFLATSLFSAAQDTQPLFRVEQMELDLGTIVAGSTVTAAFVFHNDGPDDVHIIRAKPS